MSALDDLLADYGGTYSTADVLGNYTAPGKGEYLRRAWEAMRARQTADLVQRAEQPLWGDGWLPAKGSQAGEFAKDAVLAPLAARGGLGGSTGGMGYLVPRYTANAIPETLHFPGGLGLMDEVPWLARGFASQPREILGAGVAPPLSLTKKDAKPMRDAEALWEEASKSYPLRAQAARIANDFAERPVYHGFNSLRQIPMMMGYTGAAEGAAALALAKYLPMLMRYREPPIPGTLGADIAGRSEP